MSNCLCSRVHRVPIVGNLQSSKGLKNHVMSQSSSVPTKAINLPIVIVHGKPENGFNLWIKWTYIKPLNSLVACKKFKSDNNSVLDLQTLIICQFVYKLHNLTFSVTLPTFTNKNPTNPSILFKSSCLDDLRIRWFAMQVWSFLPCGHPRDVL